MRKNAPLPLVSAVLLVMSLGCTRDRSSSEAASPQEETSVEAVAPPQATPLAWTSFSADGSATIAQEAGPGGTCQVTCTRDPGRRVWSRTGCIGKDSDFRFVSNNCDSVVVLLEYPPKEQSWRTAVVARSYRRGELFGEYQAAHFVRDSSGVKQTKGYFRWLSGALGESGTSPRYLPDGSGVSFESIDRVSHKISFLESAPKPISESANADDLAAREGILYQWVNGEGAVQFTQGLSNVPAEFRRRATPVSGDGVTVVAGDPRLKNAIRLPPVEHGSATIIAPQSTRQLGRADVFRDGIGPDGVYRNERGEDYLQFSRRKQTESFGRWVRGEPVEYNVDPTPHPPTSCRIGGDSCSRPTDCCSGACVKSRCQ